MPTKIFQEFGGEEHIQYLSPKRNLTSLWYQYLQLHIIFCKKRNKHKLFSYNLWQLYLYTGTVVNKPKWMNSDNHIKAHLPFIK